MTEKITNKKFIEKALEMMTAANIDSDYIDKGNAMLESLAKKSGADRKPTAKQIHNAEVRDNIYAWLLDNGEAHTCGEIAKLVPVLNDDGVPASSQYMSPMMNRLVADGKAEKFTDKRKTYYKAIAQ